MPTYEYACASCGEHLEVVQSFSDDPLTTCPSCGGSLRKVFGAVGIVLKGSGFYRTDNRSTSNGAHSAPKSSGNEGSESPAPANSSTSDGSSNDSASSGSGSGSGSGSNGGGKDKSAAGSSPSTNAAAS